MLNPTGNEPDELHRRALGNPKAVFAFNAYLEAINKRDELIGENQDTTTAELEIKRRKKSLSGYLVREGIVYR